MQEVALRLAPLMPPTPSSRRVLESQSTQHSEEGDPQSPCRVLGVGGHMPRSEPITAWEWGSLRPSEPPRRAGSGLLSGRGPDPIPKGACMSESMQASGDGFWDRARSLCASAQPYRKRRRASLRGRSQSTARTCRGTCVCGSVGPRHGTAPWAGTSGQLKTGPQTGESDWVELRESLGPSCAQSTHRDPER